MRGRLIAMLTPMTSMELTCLAPWAYGLAMEAAHASYPTYRDGIKTREHFLRAARMALAGDREEALLFAHEGRRCGWIQWYWQPEERYAATSAFLTEDHAAEALAELTARVAAACPGAQLDVGLDGDNAEAIAACRAQGFSLVESSVNHTFLFTEASPCDVPAHVSPLREADWPDFRRLHNDPDMYWTADRILAAGADWRNDLFWRDGRAVAALSCQSGGWPEIFSVDFVEGRFDPEAYRGLLAACLWETWAAGAAHLTFFEDREEALPILAELGFAQVGRYVLFRKQTGKGE